MRTAFPVILAPELGDYLLELTDVELDRAVLDEITSLPDEDRNQVFKVIDAPIRDYKARNK